MIARLAPIALAGVLGCGGDLDPQWQLDHDRVIAVVAEPPGIIAGGQARITGLVAFAGGVASEQAPEQALVVSPPSLASALAQVQGSWLVTAPDEAKLAAARTELGLLAGAPVPLVVGVSYAGNTLVATKTILLGAALTNPPLGDISIAGGAVPQTDIAVAAATDVPLTVNVDIEHQDVNWLTSCGTMHDFDLPAAYLRVEPADPQTGQLVVVVRDDRGGVVWRLWSIHAP